MSEDKDYLIQMRVKNAPFLRAMRRKGYYTAAELARTVGVSQQTIGGYLNLQIPAFTKRGELSQTIVQIAVHLNVLPEDLFPPQHFMAPLEKNTAELEMSFEEIGLMIDQSASPLALLESEDIRAALKSALETLSPRERYVIESTFYEGKTLDEMAENLPDINANGSPKEGTRKTSLERVRQIQAKALRKLSHPSRSNAIAEVSGRNKIKEIVPISYPAYQEYIYKKNRRNLNEENF